MEYEKYARMDRTVAFAPAPTAAPGKSSCPNFAVHQLEWITASSSVVHGISSFVGFAQRKEVSTLILSKSAVYALIARRMWSAKSVTLEFARVLAGMGGGVM
jgi:hypothetical protein